MMSKTSIANAATRTCSGFFGAEPNAFRRRIATFALFAFVVTGIVGCTTYPEVARENLRSVEHWQAYE